MIGKHGVMWNVLVRLEPMTNASRDASRLAVPYATFAAR
jgi:hypothetical protein